MYSLPSRLHTQEMACLVPSGTRMGGSTLVLAGIWPRILWAVGTGMAGVVQGGTMGHWFRRWGRLYTAFKLVCL